MGQTLSEPVVEKVCPFKQTKQLGDEGMKLAVIYLARRRGFGRKKKIELLIS